MDSTPVACEQILDNIPHVTMRLVYNAPYWDVIYVNKAIERYGYKPEDFGQGKMKWNDLLHPDDLVLAVNLSHEYMTKNIDTFKLQYRLLTKKGASIYITEYSRVNRGADGKQESIDSYLVEDLETRSSSSPEADIAITRHLALNDILLTIQDSKADPEKSIQFILDRVGALLDCSRALLFQDSPDHKTCKVVYEWLNHDISSVKDLDYAVTYSTAMPEIYVALQDTGVLLVNAGEIPENCKEEFEAEGLLSSAIFAVYRYGDHYGFVCFDDCVIKRRWDPDTANFLKVVANLLSNVVMTLESAGYIQEYEEKIKSLAFRDHTTGLPNNYPYTGDIGDAIIAAAAAKSPAYAVMIGLDRLTNVRNVGGLKTANAIGKTIADELSTYLAEAVGDRGVLYRVGGTVFTALIQPGSAEPVHAFARRVAERGRQPWRLEDKEYSCNLTVAVVPFGVKNQDPEKIGDVLDAASIEAVTKTDLPLVIRTAEE